MMAAISAADNHPGADIVIVEKNSVPGKKLSATGNGRCNLSNSSCPHHLFVLERFQKLGLFTRTDGSGRIYPYSEDAADVVRIMVSAMKKRKITVMYDTPVTGISKAGDTFNVRLRKNETSLSARNVLIAAGGKAGAQFGTTGDGAKLARSMGHTVSRLAPSLTAIETREDLKALAGVRAKCSISLYRSLQYCNDSLKCSLQDGIDSLKCSPQDGIDSLKCSPQDGIDSLKCSLTASVERRGSAGNAEIPAPPAPLELVRKETGEIQFTPYGISGICVFNLSKYMSIPNGKTLKNGFDDYELQIDFLPEIDDVSNLLAELNPIPSSARNPEHGILHTETTSHISHCRATKESTLQTPAEKSISNRPALQTPVGKSVSNRPALRLPAGESVSNRPVPLTSLLKKPLADYINLRSRGDAEKVFSMLKKFSLHPSGLRGWDFAQVTAGGVLYEEIDELTMESRKIKGLFFAGEVLDYDGPCGGYNLQHAWETGIRAGEHMLRD